MKVLHAAQIREWDQFTIQHEPVASIDLMERAAAACAAWLMKNYPAAEGFSVYCGKGNNGGDGLAIARLLLQNKYQCSIFILAPEGDSNRGATDFNINLTRLQEHDGAVIHYIQSAENIYPVPADWIIVDALLGSGTNRPLDGVAAALVGFLNAAGQPIVAIDIPSGLYADQSSKGQLTILATHTLSFQCYKPAFLFAENETAIGQIHLLHIGLHPAYYDAVESQIEMIDTALIQSIYRPRKQVAHKGHFGHALLVAGSYGKMGAAVLAARACLRSGAGLLTCYVPGSGYTILQTAVPEAMVITDSNERCISNCITETEKYTITGIGPGIGTANETQWALKQLLAQSHQPIVLDADALNLLSADKEMLSALPTGSVLTPHPKEFERLFGKRDNDFARAELAVSKAMELKVVVVQKGHHTMIATPGGQQFFNTTGNAGMATAGSGDVLTGIITGLMAQGYQSVEAAIFGVYLHGLAGDLAAAALSQEAMVAGDIINEIGKAYLQLQVTF